MDIFECERNAQEIGFDSAVFDADFPAGTFKCKWLDAYMGIFTIDADGMRDGFVMVRDISQQFPGLVCRNLRAS